ncbi:MAG: hypothetical protein U0787_22975 [Polyangia bacterium]
MKRGAMDLLYVGLGLGLVLLIAGATSCSVSSIEQPDLALACTAARPTACKADRSTRRHHRMGCRRRMG